MDVIKFTQEHEWILVEGDVATVGITEYAQEQLGDVVFVELPEVGTELEQGDDAAVVESVKAASEVYAPISGEVLEVNEELDSEPGKVNESAESDGWFYKMQIADSAELEELMDRDAYAEFIKGL